MSENAVAVIEEHKKAYDNTYRDFINPSPYDQIQSDMLIRAYDWQRNELTRLRKRNRKLKASLAILALAGSLTWLALVLS